MPNYNATQYGIEYRKKHRSYERLILPYFRKALRLTYSDIADQITTGGVILLSEMLPLMVKKTWMQEAYRKAWKEVGVRHAKWTEMWIRRVVTGKEELSEIETKAIDFRSEFFRSLMRDFYLNESSTLIQGIDDKTVSIIRGLLADAQKQGLSLLQQAEFIAGKLNDPAFSENRAMVISRTESTRSSNKATSLAAENNEYECLHRWVYINDNRTRSSHRKVGNQEPIPLNEKFVVDRPDGSGKDLMLYPGDPSADPSNSVMCRCCQMIVPVTDDNGVPIMR